MSGDRLDSEPGVVLVEAVHGRPRWRRKRVLAPAGIVTLLVLAIGAAWLSRERIAGNIIEGQLEAYGISATYEIEQIGGQRQIVRNVVVGDPARPDLTIQRAEVGIVYRLGTPQIGRVTLISPRLYGRVIEGRVSFGALDRAIYRDSGRPPGLPELDVVIRDGRALIRTPHGPLGARLEGEGQVADGFEGSVAVAAPAIAIGGCRARGASLFVRIRTSSGEPSVTGPMRMAGLSCPGRQIAVSNATAQIEGTADKRLSAFRGRVSLATGPLRLAGYGASGADLTVRGNWKDGLLDERHTVALRALATPQASAAFVTLEGSMRASRGFRRLDLRSDVEGNGLRPGPQLQGLLTQLARTGEGTLIAPLAQRFAGALSRQARGSSFAGDVAVRRSDGVTSLMLPRAELSGGGGARVLSLSRVEARFGGEGLPRLSGNIATGGPDLPQIAGRMERASSGAMVFRLAMQPYRAGSSSLAVPQLSVAQGADGAIGFAGRLLASGPLPGGAARGLALPISGRLAPDGALSLWRECVDVAFDRLQLANLSLERRGLTLCPPRGRAIVENGRAGMRIAAGAPQLDLAGLLGRTPIRIISGPVGFAFPGVMTARAVDIALGPVATASRFSVSNLEAQVGRRNIVGGFTGADIRLAAVPLDLRDASGTWRYAGGAVQLTGGDFRLVDRSADARFEPLVARDATLTLRDNIIRAQALLRNPATDRAVSEVDIVHNLGTARGHADLAVPGVLFDSRLQPVALSRRALGVIANARGTVTGTGRIDWTPDGVTSRGAFSTDGLDFAAAFGPVTGARGTINFTDLVGLTTAPGQRIVVASVNPGIEVTDGEVVFQLRGGQLLAVESGSWPFMGGRLTLRSVDLNIGVSEARRYVFDIQGLDAAVFVARFELPNVAVTGLFDGTLPIVFDTNGNGRIEGGLLASREPGGNVSYVGDLTYQDLSTIANFAFDALRSLDYRRMTIAMNGALTGEIVTNVNIEQVRQGEGARRNLITRALANLPIEFRINITAPFYQLISSFKSLRDPAAVRDPRDLGLVSEDGTRPLRPEVRGDEVPVEVSPQDIITAGDSPIQDQESETMR